MALATKAVVAIAVELSPLGIVKEVGGLATLPCRRGLVKATARPGKRTSDIYIYRESVRRP
jgi:hypothetical protein